MDMGPETLVEHFLRNIISILINEHPVCELAVPAETVATKRDVVLAAEISDLVGILPVPLAFARLERNRFHVILGSNAVEILLDEGNLIRISHIPHIDSYSDCKIVLVSVLVPCRILDRASSPEALSEDRTCAHQKGKGDSRNSFHHIFSLVLKISIYKIKPETYLCLSQMIFLLIKLYHKKDFSYICANRMLDP